MYTLRIVTPISAPIDRCFDLARDIDAHVRSTGGTSEVAVAGRTTGLIELGEEVTWRARHLGVTQHFTSRITAFDRPHYFQDRMTRGAFKFFEHDHRFESLDNGETVMTDVLRFAAPFGPLGWIAERVLLAGYLRRFLTSRAATLKSMAEQRPPPKGSAR